MKKEKVFEYQIVLEGISKIKDKLLEQFLKRNNISFTKLEMVRALTMEELIEILVEYFGLESIRDLHVKSRKGDIVKIRHLSYYIAKRHLCKPSLSFIGREIGMQDHANVLHGLKRIAKELYLPDIKIHIINLEELIALKLQEKNLDDSTTVFVESQNEDI